MASDFSGRTVIVSGGASGIGGAACSLLVERGADVVLSDIDERAGTALAGRLNAGGGGGSARFVAADVTQERDVERLVQTALDTGGTLDGALNCAGIAPRGKLLHELDLDEWEKCDAVNLRAMFLCFKYQIMAMLHGGGGSIVAISSAVALKGLIGSSEYGATKTGVLGLVRCAALDYAGSAIRVNAVLPGGTDTQLAALTAQLNPRLEEAVRIPMDRIAAPSEVAQGAVWLLSDQASYVTGASLSVDGGMAII